MTGILHELSQQRLVGEAGGVVGAIIFFYRSGTTDLAPIYTTADLSTPLANPVGVAAGAILPQIYLDPSIEYRRRIVYNDGTIDDLDPVPSFVTTDVVYQIVGTKSLMQYGAKGDARIVGTSWTGTDDSDALEALINDIRDDYATAFSETGQQSDFTKRVINTYAIVLENRFFYITRDMPALPPGCTLLGRGAVIVMGADNIRVFWTEGGTETLPKPGGGTLALFGTDCLHLELPTFIANGYSGTPVALDLVARSEVRSGVFVGFKGSSYTISAAITNGSRFIGLTPTDYAKVKRMDVINVGVNDSSGNPIVMLVKDKRVINPSATDRTYGYLKLEKAIDRTTGNYDLSDVSVPLVLAGFQQSVVSDLFHSECDYGTYYGEAGWELYSGNATGPGAGSNSDWLQESQTPISPTTDIRVYNSHQDKCTYGTIARGFCSMLYFYAPSWQFNSTGSEAVFDCINAKLINPRIEISADASTGLKAIPALVATGGCLLEVTGGISWANNAVGRYLFGQYDFASLIVDDLRQNSSGNVPQMPDSSYAPILKPGISGFVIIGSASGMTGPTVSGFNYVDYPAAWCTTGSNAVPSTGYVATSLLGSPNASRFGTLRNWTTAFELTNTIHRVGEAHPRFACRGDGNLLFGGGSGAPSQSVGSDGTSLYYNAVTHQFTGPIWVGGQEVISGLGAAISKPTGGATVDTEARAAIDAIIDRMRGKTPSIAT